MNEKTQKTLVDFLSPNLAAAGYDSLQQIPDDKSLIDLGLIDSISLISMLVQMEKDSGIKINYGQCDPELMVTIRGLEKLFSPAA
ncbi:MAG: acyl carrier protein [Succinivibrionaceae bacterium]|nr:acyl carrier protein [Succinivibrionaceae bacterium]